MAYFTEAGLEALTGDTYTATSFPTTTQIGIFATEISAMWDGLARQTEGTETPDEYVTQACLACAVYTINMIKAAEPIDPLIQIKIMKEFLVTDLKKSNLHYEQAYPDSTGNW